MSFGPGTGARRAASGLILGLLVGWAVVGCGGGGAGSTVARDRPPPHPSIESEEDLSPPPQYPARPRRIARPCGASQLVVSHSGGAGAALSKYHTSFSVFNLSSHACSIGGYPRLFALRPDGSTVEGPAGHGTGAHEARVKVMNIVGRGSAVFGASWSENVYPPGECGPRIVGRYRVVLPGSHLAQIVPYPNFEHCTGKAARVSLSVGSIEPSPEPGGPSPEPPELEEVEPGERLLRCSDSDLVVYTGVDYPGGAAAGTSYGHLEVANLSRRPCKLSGIPSMVAVDLHDRPIGPPVGRSPSMPTVDGGPPVRVARLPSHGSARFTFAVGEVLNYGTHGCEYEYAAGFDVTLPGAARPQYVPAAVRRCLHSVAPNGPQVSVGPIE